VDAYTEGGTSGTLSLAVEGSLAGTSHVVAVAPCVGEPCVAGDVSHQVTVLAYPATTIDVRSASPSLFSPNGDGRRDTTTVSYTTVVPGRVTGTIRSKTTGSLIRTLVIGTRAAGSWTFTWNGKTADGVRVNNGSYRIDLTLTTSGGSSAVDGTDVTTDVTAPNLTGITPSYATFFPRADNYRDTVALRGTLTEKAVDLELRVVNSGGRTVKKWDLATEAAGAKKQVWTGRSGSLLPAGTYRFRWYAKDAAGNIRYSVWKSVKLDLRILKAKKASRTVTPETALTDALVGGCSRLAKNVRGWTNAHGYYSFWYLNHDGRCVDDGAPDLSAAVYQTTLPTAIRYGSVKVSGVGQAHLAGSQAVLGLMYDDEEELFAQATLMDSTYGTYTTASYPISKLGFGRNILWMGGTVEGHQYDVRRFTVSWTYYALVNDGFRP
jgi:flagellar hook assembly protein FlgD